ncbi:tripartite tricarboxylate transporter substrate binding protein [Xanthobacteraceae bacterium Astr-EGSB]|uniref:Bug family tripartite tricarboxylate transporter substrate binding protein n=1 Tax=Astrobacterium formosum TaxID=3069710 RepID=UPI0027B14A6B|nr:tripartite tricarboxylate transporter substrate binding protein [Xanthobacteraceae bacterium Astr-EGSB]
MTLKSILTTAAAACMLALASAPATAQSYPSKPIKLVVPVTPGGAIDIVARMVAEKMRTTLNATVVVENKPGATNNLGADFVAKSAPDGYTILIVASNHAINKHIYKDLSYDPVKDFEPIVFTHVVPQLLAVHPSIPANNVAELITWIKANPGKAKFGTSGPGSSLHMAAELFMSMTGTKMLHVPYKGSAAAHPDLLGNRISMMFDTISAIQGHVKSGALRGLAVTTAKRSDLFPNLPTVAETLPGYEASSWGGILAPTGTPKDIIAKLNEAINVALKDDDVRAKLTGSGMQIQGGTPQEFAKFIDNEIAKWGKIIKEANIQAE